MLGGLDYRSILVAVNRAVAALAGSFVTLTGIQTLTNKTLTDPIVTNPSNTSQTLTDAANVDWNCDLGSVATLTLSATGGVTRILNAPTNPKVGTYILKAVQGDGTARGINFNAIFKFPSATPVVFSSGAGKVDIVSFFYDGTNFIGPPSAWLDVR